MDYSKIFRQAWRNVLHYRALWLFGIVLALTAFSWESALILGGDNDARGSENGLQIVRQDDETLPEAFRRTVGEEIDAAKAEIDRANRDLERFFARELDVEIESDLLAIVAVVAALMLSGYIIAKTAGYVGDAALIRTVNDTAETGEQHTVRQGWRLGWSRSALRFFLIDLLVDGAAVVAVIVTFLLVFAPLALWATGNTAAGVIGTIFTVGLFIPSLVLAIIAAALLSLVKGFSRRACALEGLGVTASARRGFAIVRRYLKEMLPVWLVTLGVNISWPFLMGPVVILSIVLGFVCGVIPALLLGGLALLVAEGAAMWILVAAVGILFFLLGFAAPLVFLAGLREVFLSSVWTLTFRELKQMESAEAELATQFGPSGLQAATPA
jgi:hypothetical protein